MPTPEVASPTGVIRLLSFGGRVPGGGGGGTRTGTGCAGDREQEILHDDKAAARLKARTARAGLAPGDPDAVARRLLESDLFQPGQTISAYIAVGDELDPRPLVTELAAVGATLCLPVLAGRGRPLLFRRWMPGDALVDVAFGLREPSQAAPLLDPHLLIVPLLAFDRQGRRLGYGGGYYDRTLRRLRATRPVLAVGFAYAGQEMPGLPSGSDDEGLDWVVTEDELIRCSGPATFT